jgi:aminomethyltransferase
MNWKNWAGFHAVSSYETLHDSEYIAFRYAAGLLDVTPLFKYRVSGPDAADFLSRIMVKNINRLKNGRVAYCCWCTPEGKIIDDGTVMRKGEENFFVTSADPSFSWFSRFLRGYNVELEDVSQKIAGLALQGPMSRDILRQICGEAIDQVRFFDVIKSKVGNFTIHVSRTGYTGDLGYELWVKNENALELWDLLFEVGKNYALRPAGLDALDITRVEAGLILKDVDYYNGLHCLIDNRKSTPYELGLGWTVNLKRDPFIGQKPLSVEASRGPAWSFMGLDLDWEEMESLFAKHGLPPELPHMAWRQSIPVYKDKTKTRQIGYATSGTWSPILKRMLALATLETKLAKLGSKVQIEFTVEHKRHTVTAVICDPQFYNPERKTSNPSTSKIIGNEA